VIRTRSTARGPVFQVVCRWQDYPVVRATFGPLGRGYKKKGANTKAKVEAAAEKFEEICIALWRSARHDLLSELKRKKLDPHKIVRMKLEDILALRVVTPSDPAHAVGALRTEWLLHIANKDTRNRLGRSYAPATVERYTECLNAVIGALPQQDGTPVQQITLDNLAGALRSLSECPPFSNGTHNRHIIAVQSFVSWLARRKPLKTHAIVLPLTAADWRELKKEEPDDDDEAAVTPDQFVAICRGTHSEDWREMWEFLAATGMRVEEAMNLRAVDVTDGTPSAWTPASKSMWLRIRDGEGFRTKTKKSARQVPVLYDETQALVLRLLHRPREAGDASLWPDPLRHYRTARWEWEKATRAAGLGVARAPYVVPGRTPWTAEQRARLGRGPAPTRWAPSVNIHGLRHLAAQTMVDAGVKLPRVRDWLGHKSLQMLDRYTRAKASADAALAARESLAGKGPIARLSSDTVPLAVTGEFLNSATSQGV
jgi:integrase